MNTSKIILFDADGVTTLAKENFSSAYARAHNLDIAPFELFFKTEWRDFVTGKRDLKQHITDNPDLWHWNGSADELLSYWFELENVQNLDLIELIKQYREKGGLCFLVTEQEKYRGEYMKTVMFPDVFDGFFITAEMGLKKDDPEFYKEILNKLRDTHPDLVPRDVILFDDSQSKIDAANSVGINGILYENVDTVRTALI